MDSTEYIDGFFNGSPDDEQKKQFERRIASDPSFAEEVAFYIGTSSLLKGQLDQEKKLRFRELFEQAKKDDRIVRPLRSIRPWRISVAAAVLLMVAGLWWVFLRQTGTEQLANEYIRQELQTQGVKMSIHPDSMQTALSAYNSGDLQGALGQFETILRTDTASFKAKQYAGLACLRLGEYNKALGYFTKMETRPGLYTNPAVFYQALTLMKRHQAGDEQNARRHLQRVVDQDLGEKETAARWLKKWPQ
ncbi:MAG TPA: hypothetical protein VK563_00950 [Puia sp.]|nr:hypothetical protein [Puia sp.]